ncbi:WhiB family transcriptional regulator [Streptomyces sp. NPDC048629]|uniref:WhiB family transcriptional regulator n=1 Tax=Streptomyces sp. NPDC048629 TaxID=3154824 RepID=UPI003420C580
MSARPLLTVPEFLEELTEAVPCSRQPHLFHPPDDGYQDHGARLIERTRRAIALCGVCPVVRPCRKWARERGEFGIWGAETDRQRIAAGHLPQVRGVAHNRPGLSVAAADAPPPPVRKPAPRPPEAEPSGPARLSAAEREVLDLMLRGVDPEDMRVVLGRTRRSVARSLHTLGRKLGTGRAGIVAAAYRTGLVSVTHDPAA